MSGRSTWDASVRGTVLGNMFLAGLIGAGLVGPNRPRIEEAFGLSHTTFGVGVAVSQLLSSALVLCLTDRLCRLGSFTLLSLATAIQIVGFLLVSAAGGVVTLAAGWALISGGATITSVTNKVAIAVWADNPQRGVNLLHAVNGAGKVAGPVVAAACLAVLSWRASFVAVGVMCLAMMAAFLCVRRAGDAFDHAEPASGHPLASGWGEPRLWWGVAGLALIAGGEMAFATLAPLFFQETRGLSASKASFVLSVHLFGLVAGRWVTTWFGSTARPGVVVGACMACGLAVLPATLVSSPFVYLPSVFLLGGIFSAVWPTFFAQTALLLRGSRSRFAMAAGFGNVLGWTTCITLSSLVADRSLLFSVWFGPMVLWLFGLLYWAFDRVQASPHANEA